jgi:hypothetical protein
MASSPLVSLAHARLRKHEIYASPSAGSVQVRLHTAMAGTDGLTVDVHDAICVWNIFPGAGATVIGRDEKVERMNHGCVVIKEGSTARKDPASAANLV